MITISMPILKEKRTKAYHNWKRDTFKRTLWVVVSEEELTGYDGYRWSLDSEYIAFGKRKKRMFPNSSMIEELTSYPV